MKWPDRSSSRRRCSACWASKAFLCRWARISCALHTWQAPIQLDQFYLRLIYTTTRTTTTSPEHSWFALWTAGVQTCKKTKLVTSVAVLEESPCPRGPIYKSLSLSLSSDLKSLSLDHKVLENCQGFHILQTPCHGPWACHWNKVESWSYRHRTWGYGEEWLT